MKNVAPALAAGLLLASASTSNAAIMMATIEGGWNDHDFWDDWRVEITYDTQFLRKVNTATGPLYTWKAGDGRSPIISARGTFSGECQDVDDDGEPDECGRSPKTVGFNIQAANSFEIANTELLPAWFDYPAVYELVFRLDAPGISFGLGHEVDGPIDIEAPFSLSDLPSSDFYGIYGGADLAGADLDDMPIGEWIEISVLGPSPTVPEPGTWGLMIAGFGMAGAAMRSRRPRDTRREPAA